MPRALATIMLCGLIFVILSLLEIVFLGWISTAKAIGIVWRIYQDLRASPVRRSDLALSFFMVVFANTCNIVYRSRKASATDLMWLAALNPYRTTRSPLPIYKIIRISQNYCQGCDRAIWIQLNFFLLIGSADCPITCKCPIND